MDIVIVTNEYT